MATEWCVMHPLYPDTPHRGPWSEEACRQWVNETLDQSGERPRGGFYVAKREVGPWEPAS